MRLVYVLRVLIFGIAFTSIPAALPAQSALTPADMMKTYCVSCHNGQSPAARLSLDQLDANRPAEAAGAWERVVRQLRARTMPPMTAPRPDSKMYESTIAALTGNLDRAATTTADPLTDTQLASRLAKLIWNGEPDQALRDAAAQGRLHDPQALQRQVRRMLSDSKSSALVSGFFDTWLSLDDLAAAKSDNTLFPEFTDDLRADFRRETELFVESQLHEDRNPVELWTANYTFLNQRLARHYGVSNVAGPEFRPVTWPGPERAGCSGREVFSR